jgi:phage terminase large subunit GpA-like protein
MHVDLGQHWFDGMVSERPRRKRNKKGQVVVEWIPNPNVRNEPWDLTVYNLALAYKLGLHKWAAQDWARLRAKLIPKVQTGDLFAELPAPAPPSAPQLVLESLPVVEPDQVHHDQHHGHEEGAPAEAHAVAAAAPPAPSTAALPPAPPRAQAIAPLLPLNPQPSRRRRVLSRGI